MQGKKFISPGAWFSMNYPSDWNEFEDGEGSFLLSIYPTGAGVWTGVANLPYCAYMGLQN